MKTIRRVLYPFSLIYKAVASIRNYFFDTNFFISHSYSIPIIAVGNLSVGGTGKTPQIEYLIRLLANYKLATISRGYKRKTKGMLIANNMHTVDDLGDEPFQFHNKFPDLTVVVSANRVEAIDYLLAQPSKPDVILLDDAMQHRKVTAGFYIMLTAFSDFFYNDLVLPAGNLRESRYGAQRASCIVVTKCPDGLSEQSANEIKTKIARYAPNIPVYFSKIGYDICVYNDKTSVLLKDLSTNYILLAGIAKPEPFFNKLQTGNILTLEYPDHYNFSAQDIQQIMNQANGKLIITTEKDYMRLMDKIPTNQLFYLPIQSQFLFQDASYFNEQVMQFLSN